jgi:hypothetical protein
MALVTVACIGTILDLRNFVCRICRDAALEVDVRSFQSESLGNTQASARQKPQYRGDGLGAKGVDGLECSGGP